MIRVITFAFTGVALLGLSLSECSAELVKGIIKELDVEVGTITVFVGGRGADIKIVKGKGKVQGGAKLEEKPRVLNLKSPNIPVLLADGNKAKLSDLKAGLPITLQVSDDEDVEAIVAGFSVRSGPLQAIDMEKKQLIVDGGKKGADATYTFAADAAVTINGHKKSLRELRTGHHLLLMMSLDQKSVVSIVAMLKRTADDPRGAIVGIDSTNHTITLLVGRDGNFRVATWPVAADFQFVLNENQRLGVKLSDLPVVTKLTELERALTVWLRLSDDHKTAAAIVAEPAIVQAVIESIDVDKRTLVARLGDARVDSFVIAADADIRFGSKLASLDRLSAGMSVQLTLSFEPGRVLGVRTKKE